MKQAQDKTDHWRLNYHLMPPSGWLNDPNGLCFFQGRYHVFFQYTPENPNGAMKYWGHYASSDMVTWENLGIALYPDKPFDRSGVYSGSALIIADEMHLFYTGNVKLEGCYNYVTDGREGNTIHVISRDGIHFGVKRCVIGASDYPKGLTCHVRDPKVWMETNGGISEYYMILGARTLENHGQMLIYRSDDLECWDYTAAVRSEEPFGYMWECPDVFSVNGINILSLSPQGVSAQGNEYRNTYQSGYYLYKGKLTCKYELGRFREWDRGFDFYAPQTFEDIHGRRILIGWMGMPDTPAHINPTVTLGWQHALTIPREIFSESGRITQRPVIELESLRMAEQELLTETATPVMASFEAVIYNPSGLSMKLSIGYGLTATFDKEQQEFTLQFSDNKTGGGRTKRGVKATYCHEVRLFVDSSSVELFINGGEESFTTRFYPKEGKSNLVVAGEGCIGSYWELKPYTILAADNS